MAFDSRALPWSSPHLDPTSVVRSHFGRVLRFVAAGSDTHARTRARTHAHTKHTCLPPPQGAPNKVVLIVAHEVITPSFYEGKHRSFLISNLLFREGGAAAIMSNRRVRFALYFSVCARACSVSSARAVWCMRACVQKDAAAAHDCTRAPGNALQTNSNNTHKTSRARAGRRTARAPSTS